jgi:hypothetical protein
LYHQLTVVGCNATGLIFLSEGLFINFIIFIFVDQHLILCSKKLILVIKKHLLRQISPFHFLNGDSEAANLIGFDPLLGSFATQEILGLDHDQDCEGQDEDRGHAHHYKDGDVGLDARLDDD